MLGCKADAAEMVLRPTPDSGKLTGGMIRLAPMSTSGLFNMAPSLKEKSHPGELC